MWVSELPPAWNTSRAQDCVTYTVVCLSFGSGKSAKKEEKFLKERQELQLLIEKVHIYEACLLSRQQGTKLHEIQCFPRS